MLGWLTLPDEIKADHIGEINKLAADFRKSIDVFVSLGIGGSYLGIEATFRALTHTYFNQLSRQQRGDIPEIYFLGQNLDPDFFRDTLDNLSGRRIGINVISKSGTTTETTIAFRLLRTLLEKASPRTASSLIVATTDRSKGALRTLANQKGYRTLIVPDNIGGRFSVLSDVGLFGLAVGGVDIAEFVAGFKHMKSRLANLEFWCNPAMVHAAVRYLAFKKEKRIEVIACNSTHIYQLARWMEQLFPESEGHKGYGMWVSPSLYSEKLHANGQMVQDGVRNILETFLCLDNHDNSVPIPPDPED
jgi:glucose-6-phosphate isomerase